MYTWCTGTFCDVRTDLMIHASSERHLFIYFVIFKLKITCYLTIHLWIKKFAMSPSTTKYKKYFNWLLLFHFMWLVIFSDTTHRETHRDTYIILRNCRELTLIVLLGTLDHVICYRYLVCVCVLIRIDNVLIVWCGVSWIPLSQKGASQSSFLASFNRTCPRYIRSSWYSYSVHFGAVTRIRLSLPPL